MSESQVLQRKRLSDEKRRDIEMMLIGAAAIRASSETVLDRVTRDLVNANAAEMLEALQRTFARNSIDPKVSEWLEVRGIVLERGDDLLAGIVRLLEEERQLRTIQNMAVPMIHALKHGDREEVVRRMKRCLIELGELPQEENES